MELIIPFNFSRAVILGFDVTALPYNAIISNKRTSAFQQQKQCSDIMKSKMAACGKFKSRNLFCLLLLNVTFVILMGIIWSNLVSTRTNS